MRARLPRTRSKGRTAALISTTDARPDSGKQHVKDKLNENALTRERPSITLPQLRFLRKLPANWP